MKRSLLLLIIIIAVYSQLKAQDFVVYKGAAEKTLIDSGQTPDDFIKLAFASELNNDEYQVLYTKFLQEIKELNLDAIPNDISGKHLKKVYDIVHDHFLKNYNPNANFGDFVVNGEYQSLSGAILYAYILEKLKAPYQIAQLPAHFYVVANPGTDNVKFETMDISKGIYVIDDASKQRDVINFIKAGYIDQSYAIRVGTERAFDEFFYDKADLTLKEAVGLVYFNRAMEEIQSDNAAGAYSDLCKSDILFPDKKNQFFKDNLMTNMIYNFKYDDIKDWRALTHMANNNNATDDLKKFVIFQFENFLNSKLINAGQKDKVNEVYNYLHANLIDTAIKKHVAEDYFFETAQYSYLTNDYTQALNCLEIAYGINPNNPLIVSNFTQMILHKYSGQNPTTQNLDAFAKYMDKYPSLKNNPVIASLNEYYMSVISLMAFVSGDGVKGEKYLQLLTQQLDTHPDNDNKFHQPIASAFARASVYYWQKKQKQKAIAVLNLGLKYEPNNEELQRKLKADSGN